MKSFIRNIMAATAIIGATAPLAAQENYSGYFLENYVYRHEMNPAFSGAEHGFVAFPGLGNINVGLHGNLDVRDIFYNRNGKTVLFSNPDVSAAEALSKFNLQNKFEFGTRLHVIDFGFGGLGGYNTVGINVVTSGNVSVPYDIFSIIKEGVTNKTYDLAGLNANAQAYAEVALNHSHNIRALPGLRVGATVKFLVGVGNIEAKIDEMQLMLHENSWDVKSNAHLYASVKNLELKTKYSDFTHQQFVNDFGIEKFGINGFGVGFDLGAQYRWREFSFSAAILDLGFINYDQTYKAVADGEFQSDAFTFTVGEGGHTWRGMRDELLKLAQLRPENDGKSVGKTNKSLTSTLNVGVNYEFPLYDRLNFGLLSSTRFCGDFTRTQLRLSANVHPVNAISVSVNGVYDTFGVGFGWMLNIAPKGFNLFLGMDQTFAKLSKQGIPLGSNAQVNFGINFPF